MQMKVEYNIKNSVHCILKDKNFKFGFAYVGTEETKAQIKNFIESKKPKELKDITKFVQENNIQVSIIRTF